MLLAYKRMVAIELGVGRLSESWDLLSHKGVSSLYWHVVKGARKRRLEVKISI